MSRPAPAGLGILVILLAMGVGLYFLLGGEVDLDRLARLFTGP